MLCKEFLKPSTTIVNVARTQCLTKLFNRIVPYSLLINNCTYLKLIKYQHCSAIF